jgi:4-hydroxy-tetrahydrodipicolinate reductase
MAGKLSFLSYGLGTIGVEVLRYALHHGQLTLAGAVDTDPSKVGKDVSELLGLEEPTGVRVHPRLEDALEQVRPDLVFHATGSYLEDVATQLYSLLEAGLPVVSTCEELSYPWPRHPEISRRLDHLALQRGIALVGTGVNPGFAMDTLPICLSAVCRDIRAVEVSRVANVARRRRALQAKMGLGISVEEYYTRLGTGRFGHVGLEESAWMIAAAFGWEVTHTESTIDPIVAQYPTRTAYFEVPRGHLSGIRQTTTVTCEGNRRIYLELVMQIEPAEEKDEVKLEADPPIHTITKGGFFGDTATAAIVVNAGFALLRARPGLRSMWELPYVHFASRHDALAPSPLI